MYFNFKISVRAFSADRIFPLCHMGLTKPRLATMLSLCKCSSVDCIIECRKKYSVVCYLNAKFKFLQK